MDYRYDWDENKNLANIKKHGISFETATLVFNDENRIEIYDESNSTDEERYNTIGRIEDVVLLYIL